MDEYESCKFEHAIALATDIEYQEVAAERAALIQADAHLKALDENEIQQTQFFLNTKAGRERVYAETEGDTMLPGLRLALARLDFVRLSLPEDQRDTFNPRDPIKDIPKAALARIEQDRELMNSFLVVQLAEGDRRAADDAVAQANNRMMHAANDMYNAFKARHPQTSAEFSQSSIRTFESIPSCQALMSRDQNSTAR